jgi:hypothetical protein
MARCNGAGVHVMQSPTTGVAAFNGLQTCGSVWACPVCSQRITNHRREELNKLLPWARRMGYQVMLLTLTTRHAISDSLHQSMLALKAAKTKWHNTRAFRGIAGHLVGYVTATEVTHGAHGWHPHFHVLLLVDAPNEQTAVDILEVCRSAWLAALLKCGLEGNDYAYNVQGASNAGEYISKWGAGEELTLSSSKEAKTGGRSPWGLLAAATQGDSVASALFVEYAREFRGKRQLVWSKYLKSLLGIIERNDDELADIPDADDMQPIAFIGREMWKVVVRRKLQAELLEVAEEGGVNYVLTWLLALELQIKRGI